MYTAPQIEPITTLARNHKSLLEKLKDGPVFLTQRGTEAAVMVAASEWRSIIQRLELLEQERRLARLERSKRVYATMLADPTQVVNQAEYEQLLAEAGLST